ncbi:putative short-chain dehydrogenases/reductase [Vararia minispora EC-137]|uniref:Short-chain dehydrogenases/reductase n=1 Tax=Vararia minispora EC-137 TaxID=1314806 RepID=A0ACB8Q7T6_9AGAM|nr:putative short-chain dehydrogenases/reductase [Vararia minispora EC-137]
MTGHNEPRYVLITGCTTGGLGHALALEFCKRGCRVIATARNPARMQDLVDRSDVDTVPLDVCDAASIARAKEAVQALTGGRLDVLVNCAGGAYVVKPAIELGASEDLEMFDLNFHAAVRMVTAFAPLVLAVGKGAKIVSISSVGAYVPMPYLGMYAAAKGALNSYGNALRVELSPFGVDVLTIMAGAVANSKNVADVSLTLSPNSLYKPLQAGFSKTYVEANAKQAPAAVFARNVVREALKPRSRDVLWTGGQALMCWILVTFVPHSVLKSMMVNMWDLNKLSSAALRKAD